MSCRECYHIPESNPGVQLSTNSLLLPQTVDMVGDNKAAIMAVATASDRRKLKRSDNDLQINMMKVSENDMNRCIS